MREIEDILVDCFIGEEPLPEEILVLEEWLQQKDNAKLIQVLRKMQVGAKVRNYLRQNPQQGIRSIWRKVDVHRSRKRLLYVSFSVAVCLLLFLGGAFLYWGNMNRSMKIEYLTSSDSIVGGSFARLKLADGKVISLNANQNEIIVVDSFIKIENSNNTLIYNRNAAKKEVKFNTLSVPKGIEYNVVLSDGTKVYLNAGSELRFPAVFSENTREVYLEGEGYFEVVKDSVRRFEVRAFGMTVIVLGTSFNVKAYRNQKQVATTLEKGHLKIVCDNQKEYDLRPGNQIQYDKETRVAVMKKVDTKYYTSWKDGYFYYDDVRLEDMLDELGEWFGFTVFYQDPEVKDYRYRFWANRKDSKEKILDYLRGIGKLQIELKEDSVIVSL